PWARLHLAQLLLERATRRFRERAQAPMLARASALFTTMTGGRYAALRIDDDDGHPVLQAERAPGQPGSARVGIDALSEGTADQLFLALRLAALDLRRGDGAGIAPPMPLVLDDVLMTADDERATCVLQALAEHAHGGQVLLFTHHRHLAELAQARLAPSQWLLHRL
ncbi:MAG: ATP-binding protein, partial [Leptothrix sp. (in: b-proteobacteria)]